MNKKKKILLHACCAPCIAGVYDQLKQNLAITLFWYNPNIYPKSEHDRRLNELLNYCDKQKIKIIVGDYFWQDEHNFFLRQIKGLEKEPERGKRCEICYSLRIKATTAVGTARNKEHQRAFDLIGTGLSISPYKDAVKINTLGNQIAKLTKIQFLAADFKKNDGYKRSCELSKKLGLYRQSYCGCEFSLSLKNLRLEN